MKTKFFILVIVVLTAMSVTSSFCQEDSLDKKWTDIMFGDLRRVDDLIKKGAYWSADFNIRLLEMEVAYIPPSVKEFDYGRFLKGLRELKESLDSAIEENVEFGSGILREVMEEVDTLAFGAFEVKESIYPSTPGADSTVFNRHNFRIILPSGKELDYIISKSPGFGEERVRIDYKFHIQATEPGFFIDTLSGKPEEVSRSILVRFDCIGRESIIIKSIRESAGMDYLTIEESNQGVTVKLIGHGINVRIPLRGGEIFRYYEEAVVWMLREVNFYLKLKK